MYYNANNHNTYTCISYYAKNKLVLFVGNFFFMYIVYVYLLHDYASLGRNDWIITNEVLYVYTVYSVKNYILIVDYTFNF